MAPRGSIAKGETRNPHGKPKGTKNKITIERERLAMEAMRSASSRKAMGLLLAREVLAEAMMATWGMAEECWKNKDEKRAMEFTVVAADIAAKLAPYESPRLESITVHKADPYAEMTDQQLYSELCRRAEDIGLVMPSTPKLIEGVAVANGVEH